MKAVCNGTLFTVENISPRPELELGTGMNLTSEILRLVCMFHI